MNMETEPGRLFIVSAPSGAGKTTLCRAIRQRYTSLAYSVSYTTRAPRGGETDGIDYHFIDRSEFKRGIRDGRWAEWADVYGNYYGTSAEVLARLMAEGQHILLDIDVQGAGQILKRFPDSIGIFIMPPSMDVLRARLEGRGTDDPRIVKRRLDEADVEMGRRDMYRHVVVNDDLVEATDALDELFAGYIGKAKQPPAPVTDDVSNG